MRNDKMKRIFNWKEKVNEIELEKISKDLRIGKVAIFPTETVYGIGANVFDESAVKKIYKIKKGGVILEFIQEFSSKYVLFLQNI